MTLTGGASLEGLVRQWPGYVLVSPETQGFRSTRVQTESEGTLWFKPHKAVCDLMQTMDIVRLLPF